MNIALFSDIYPPYINGVSTSVFNLAKTLREHGDHVVVVTPRYDEGKLEYRKEEGLILMPGIALKHFYGYRFTKLYDRRVMKILKSLHIQLIHNQTDSTVGFFARKASKKLKVPLVYTYHTSMEDYSQYASGGYLDRIFKGILRIYSKRVAKSATEYITPSTKTKEYMRGLGNDIYINVVPTGIDFSLFDELHRDIPREEEFKKAHGITPNTKVLLVLGRMGYEKSVDVVVKCFAKYLETHPHADMKLLAVGGGPEKENIELLTHELRISQDVIFTGAVPSTEVPFYYHLADLYVSASITETQGLTFMEAMASGNVVLARFDNNLSSTIIEGSTGFYFSDEKTFADKVDRIFSLTNEEKQAIRTHQLELLETYSIEKFYHSVMEVYNRAIKKYW